ncbi:family 16 glycosylhydrolase [Streptomyces sp. NPDC050523]|uniref:family 16 glycosylhydrolase n=1 Tax=Streptomyces sp. NPDC050523 TaxID=3365622 RepID=UPI0037BACC0C
MASHRARRYTYGGVFLLIAAAVLTALIFSGLGPISSHAEASVGAQTWSDEFNGPAGSAPSAVKWKAETGGSGSGNSELQYYTDSRNNAALDGKGHLVITARKGNPSGYDCWYGPCQYTSAKLTTAHTFTQAYGRFEARIKVPRGQGIWPAFWMLGEDIGRVGWPANGEIDIMENIGREPGKVHGSLHGPGYSGSDPLTASYRLRGGKDFADGFHTYRVDWTPGSITFFVDGVKYERRTPSDVPGKPWPYDHPFYMILNVAVGGTWPGSPDASTRFPQQMIVDHVRVHAWKDGGGKGDGAAARTGRITGIGGMCVDVAGASSADRTPIQLHTCTGNAAQRWTVHGNGPIKALGKCLDVSGGSTATGAKIQLYRCNGTGAQQWKPTSEHTLVNPKSGKCLGTEDNGSTDGTRLQLSRCTGDAHQKWSLP